MTALADQIAPSRGRRGLLALLLAGTLIGGACSSSESATGEVTTTTLDDGPNQGALPTLAGGLELASAEPVQVLTGDGLSYGQPLPSEQVAADAYLDDPEVTAVTARRVYSLLDGRLIGEALVLELDGSQLFDEGVLDAFVRGTVANPDGDDPEAVELGGRKVVSSRGSGRTSIAYVEGNLLVVVRGADDHDTQVVVERQLAALGAGIAGAPDPRTPLVPLPLDAAFVAVPTVVFAPIPPPEQEPAPEPPPMAGATAVEGRYGVVAGERRTTVWAYTVDPQTYPWAEPLEAALADLASARAGGAPAEAVEVLGRVVQQADGTEGSPSTRAFRHGGLALLVEGSDPAQVDAVVSAWIAALGGR